VNDTNPAKTVRGTFPTVFEGLRAILSPYEGALAVVHDSDAYCYLDTHHQMPNGQKLFFGAVQIEKSYVSFYLMPVYVFPELLDGISDSLRARMHGKSCFNFKTVDPSLFGELAQLALRGFERYRDAGYAR
jgi:hypothetical protein